MAHPCRAGPGERPRQVGGEQLHPEPTGGDRHEGPTVRVADVAAHHRTGGHLEGEPVGQLLLYIFDYRDPVLHRYANDIATALELTHFLQDLSLDLARDHLYIPEEDLRHFGVTEDELGSGHVTRAMRDLMRFQAARVRALFMRGRPLTDRLGRDLGFELSLIWQGGMTILDKIDAQDGDVLSRRPRLGTVDKVRMVTSSAARRWPIFGDRE